eukprot:5274506-Prymnesium_polylepis.1
MPFSTSSSQRTWKVHAMALFGSFVTCAGKKCPSPPHVRAMIRPTSRLLRTAAACLWITSM